MQLCIILIEDFLKENKAYLTFSSLEEAFQALIVITMKIDEKEINSIDRSIKNADMILNYINELNDFKLFVEHKTENTSLQLKSLSWIKEELYKFFNINT